MSKSAGLGRGLDELFGAQPEEPSTGPVTMLDIDVLEPNRDQPRRNFDEARLASLADSIAQHGVITPLTVRKIADVRYRIIAGERRYRASRRAGLTEVPVIVLDADELHATELALVENLQRADLNPMEEAEGYRSLIDRFDLRQEDVAARVGRSRSAVANALRLLDLPEAIAEHVVDGDLSAGHARALLALDDAKIQAEAAERVMAEELSVRQTEQLVKRIKAAREAAETPPQPGPVQPDYVGELARELSTTLGRSVKITSNSKNKGRIVLDYYSLDDLDELLKLLRVHQD